MKLRYFVSVLIVLLVFVLYNVFFEDEGKERISEGFQCNYILTNTDSQGNDIEFFVYESFVDSEVFDISTVEDAYILDAQDNKIEVEIKSIHQDESQIYTSKGELYKKTISLCICNADVGLYKNTKLYIKTKNKSETYEYDFGEIYIQEKGISEYSNEDLEILQITPVVSRVNDIPYTVGLILEIDAKDDIQITDFNMGISDYYTFKSNITRLDVSFQTAIELDDQHKLDTVVKDIYSFSDIQDATNSTSSCILEKGIQVVVIPFAFSENSKFIYSSGGTLKYKVGENENEVLLQPSRRLAISRLSREAIEKEVFGE